MLVCSIICRFFFQAEDGIRDGHVTGVQTCALPISIPIFPELLLKALILHPSFLHGVRRNLRQEGPTAVWGTIWEARLQSTVSHKVGLRAQYESPRSVSLARRSWRLHNIHIFRPLAEFCGVILWGSYGS